jgi:hypothetical protein
MQRLIVRERALGVLYDADMDGTPAGAGSISGSGHTPLSVSSIMAREAPLGSLLVAFLFGVAVARHR